MYKLALSVAVASLAAVLVMGAPQDVYRGFLFSDGAEQYLSAPLSTSFTCEGQAYGYYADVDNNCEIFHVCVPIEDDLGQVIDTYQYSFICGNATVFDQATLTCNYPEFAFPCSESPSLYGSIEYGVKLDSKK